MLAGVALVATTGHAGAAMSAPTSQAGVAKSAATGNVAPVAALGSLSTFVGTWNCSSVVTSPDGSKSAFETTPNTDFILDGTFMRWQEVNSVEGTPIGSAEYIWGWDERRQVFTVDSFGSYGQRTVVTGAGWVGDSITMKGTTSQPDGSLFRTSIKFTTTGASTFTVRAVVRLDAEENKVVSRSSCAQTGGSSAVN